MSTTQHEAQQHQAPAGLAEQGNMIFALDIGTRSVIGVVGKPVETSPNDLLQVMDVEVREHTHRAMMDGQIEDINEVARVAQTVKSELESRLGVRLKKVHVAAAGRALKTNRTVYAEQIDPEQVITSQTVSRLEAAAIHHAEEQLYTEDGCAEAAVFYCVGFSVMQYFLDDYPISTLVHHKGRSIQVEMITTFLPAAVVDSLGAVMSRVGLDIASLTLEPIAAMNAVIPNELRILNLALVDIGAGTSDIAVCRDGAVVAYTMATVAGDEVTEAIVKQYLVDFQTAENLKISLSSEEDTISFCNILGMEQTVPRQQMLDCILPSVTELCSEIARRIMEINEQPPQAVFLVGGGSKMPFMREMVAESLQIDVGKVAVGGNNYMKQIVSSGADVAGPEFVTPIGITLTASRLAENGFRAVVNGREVFTFKTTNVTVLDALQSCGIGSSQIMGRSGKSVCFQLNGQRKLVRGGHPVPASVTVNGKPAGIATVLSSGDQLVFVPARNGEDAAPCIRDVIGSGSAFNVIWNGTCVQAGVQVLCNGKKTEHDAPVRDNDVLELYDVTFLEDLLQEVNSTTMQDLWLSNGQPVSGKYRLQPGDVLTYGQHEQEHDQPPVSEPTAAEEKESVIPQNLSVQVNGQLLTLKPKSDLTPYQFVDILNYVDIDPTKPNGELILTLNGRQASYVERLHEHDVIKIGWSRD